MKNVSESKVNFFETLDRAVEFRLEINNLAHCSFLDID